MSKFSSAVRSMRLRTLPLSLSGVCLGMMLAASDYRISWAAALFTILTNLISYPPPFVRLVKYLVKIPIPSKSFMRGYSVKF